MNVPVFWCFIYIYILCPFLSIPEWMKMTVGEAQLVPGILGCWVLVRLPENQQPRLQWCLSARCRAHSQRLHLLDLRWRCHWKGLEALCQQQRAGSASGTGTGRFEELLHMSFNVFQTMKQVGYHMYLRFPIRGGFPALWISPSASVFRPGSGDHFSQPRFSFQPPFQQQLQQLQCHGCCYQHHYQQIGWNHHDHHDHDHDYHNGGEHHNWEAEFQHGAKVGDGGGETCEAPTIGFGPWKDPSWPFWGFYLI